MSFNEANEKGWKHSTQFDRAENLNSDKKKSPSKGSAGGK